MKADKNRNYFVITYRDPKDGKIMELKAYRIHDSSLGLGFVSISDFFFDSENIVVSPEEETLRKRLENVKTLHLSIYSILSVSEMGTSNRGLKFQKEKSNLLVLPRNEPAPKN